jgi:hypothetical protein
LLNCWEKCLTIRNTNRRASCGWLLTTRHIAKTANAPEDCRATASSLDLTKSISPERLVNYEAWNRDVLIAIGLFTVLLYAGLLCAGIAEFGSRLAKRQKNHKRFRNRATISKLQWHGFRALIARESDDWNHARQ